ncbi:MAG: GAF domain-containing protein [Candidatus Andersenbacteria bacterium]
MLEAFPTPKEPAADLVALRGSLADQLESNRASLVQTWVSELRRTLHLPTTTGLPDPATQALSYKELDRLLQQLIQAIRDDDYAALPDAAAANHHEPREHAYSIVPLLAKLTILGDTLRRHVAGDAAALYLLDRVLIKLSVEATLVFAARRKQSFDRITDRSETLKETLEAILDSSPVGILVTDRDGYITYFNREQERVSGVSRDKALGRKLYVEYARRTAEDVRAAFRKAVEQGATTSFLRRRYEGRGGAQILDVQMGPIRDDAGRIAGTVHICRDVSDLATLEDKLLQRNRELAAKVHELEEAYTYIGKVNRQFASLIDVNSTLGTQLSLDKVLDFIVRSAAMLTRARLVTLRRLEPNGRTLTLAAHYGFTAEQAAHYRPVDIDQSVIGRVIRENRPILVVDLNHDVTFQFPELVEDFGLKSLVSVPLNSRGRTIGTLSIHLPESRSFSNLELNFLIALANQAALAIDLERTLRTARRPAPTPGRLPISAKP